VITKDIKKYPKIKITILSIILEFSYRKKLISRKEYSD
jgi:hypothetical protein